MRLERNTSVLINEPLANGEGDKFDEYKVMSIR